MKLPKAILFDADGTLYDSERIQFEATRQTARHLHDFDFTWELYETHMMRGSKGGHQILLEHGFDSDEAAYHAHKKKLFSQMVAEQLTLMPGIYDFLQWCETSAIQRLIVSSSRREQIEAALTTTGLADFFEIIISTEDVQDKKKPHPHPFEEGLRRAGVTAEQALAVEDTAKGIKAAQAAGLGCIGIRNDVNNATELAKAEFVIEDYSQLKTYLIDDFAK